MIKVASFCLDRWHNRFHGAWKCGNTGQLIKVAGHLAANFSIHNSFPLLLLKRNSEVGGQLGCTAKLLQQKKSLFEC